MAEGSPAEPAHFFARVLADQHYQKGAAARSRGSGTWPSASYRRACALDPHNVLYLLARGHVCQTHGLEPEAEECYRVALGLRPDDTVALYNQAQLFAARGELDEARTNLSRIVSGGVEELGERAAPIFCRLGDIAVRRDDYTLAAAVHFRRALECTPGTPLRRAALAGWSASPSSAGRSTTAEGSQPKVAFYGYAGAMLLGLPEDDGIDVPAYPGAGLRLPGRAGPDAGPLHRPGPAAGVALRRRGRPRPREPAPGHRPGRGPGRAAGGAGRRERAGRRAAAGP